VNEYRPERWLDEKNERLDEKNERLDHAAFGFGKLFLLSEIVCRYRQR